MSYIKRRVNPYCYNVNDSGRNTEPWEKGQKISLHTILLREFEMKKSKKLNDTSSINDRDIQAPEILNYFRHESQILKRCLASLGIYIESYRTARKGKGFAFCVLDAEFCYFLLTSDRRSGGYFSRLKNQGVFMQAETQEFLCDFSKYLADKYDCSLNDEIENPTMSEGSFFLPFFKSRTNAPSASQVSMIN